jgi:hypothetical protein
MPPDITSFHVWCLAMRGFPSAIIGIKPDILTFSPAKQTLWTLVVAGGPSLAVWLSPTLILK